MPTKQKKKVRVNGKWRKPEDVHPATFASNFPNYSVTMDSYKQTSEGPHIGRRLDFSPNGTYETKDEDEIEFLKRHMKTCGPISKVEMKHDIRLKEKVKESE